MRHEHTLSNTVDCNEKETLFLHYKQIIELINLVQRKLTDKLQTRVETLLDERDKLHDNVKTLRVSFTNLPMHSSVLIPDFYRQKKLGLYSLLVSLTKQRQSPHAHVTGGCFGVLWLWFTDQTQICLDFASPSLCSLKCKEFHPHAHWNAMSWMLCVWRMHFKCRAKWMSQSRPQRCRWHLLLQKLPLPLQVGKKYTPTPFWGAENHVYMLCSFPQDCKSSFWLWGSAWTAELLLLRTSLSREEKKFLKFVGALLWPLVHLSARKDKISASPSWLARSQMRAFD